MKVLSRGAAVLAVTVLFPVMAAAQQPANRPQLSEQQREQLRTLEEQQRQALEATQRELGDLHRQLNEQLTAAQPDAGKINSLRSAIAQRQSQLAQARVDRLVKLSSILTTEQRQSLQGRGLEEWFGPGVGRLGGRGGAFVGQRGPAGADRMILQRRQQVEREAMARRGGRGVGGGGGVVRGMPPAARGGGRGMAPGARGGGAGAMQRFGGGRGAGGGNEIEQLRAEIRRLEAQIEALRRRIR